MKAVGVVVLAVIVLGVIGGCNLLVGAGGWGPTRVQDVTVQRTYVDYSGSGDNKASHYMVATDKGMFECDNGLLLGIWNADEVYGKMQGGKRYRITTKGNKVVGMWYQEYPYVVAVEPLPDVIVPAATLESDIGTVEKPYDAGSEPYPWKNIFLGGKDGKTARLTYSSKELVYDLRSNSVPLVVILKDGTKIRYGE